MREKIKKDLVLLLNTLTDNNNMAPQNSKDFVIKHFDLPELRNIEPTHRVWGDFKKYKYEDIQNVNISNQKLVNVAMTLLVFCLFHNLFPGFLFEDGSLKFMKEYNEIAGSESEFMKEMRKQYMEDDKLKDDLTYSRIMEKMLALTEEYEFKNELTITLWDKFCHFFAQIVKLICNLFGVEYKSTLDVKITQNAEIQQHNEKVGYWVKFAKDFKSEVQSSINLN